MAKRIKRENVWNVPNALSIIRVLIGFVLIYMVLARFRIETIVVVFTAGMLTDFIDGKIARRFKQTTEFGRKADIIADRILLVGTMTAIIFDFTARGLIGGYELFQIFIVMSREIISLPFVLLMILSRKEMPHAKFVGKLTTFMQGFAVPIILLSIFYEFFNFSIYLAILTGAVGVVSAFTFIGDVMREAQK